MDGRRGNLSLEQWTARIDHEESAIGETAKISWLVPSLLGVGRVAGYGSLAVF